MHIFSHVWPDTFLALATMLQRALSPEIEAFFIVNSEPRAYAASLGTHIITFASHLHAHFLFQWEALSTMLDEDEIEIARDEVIKAVRKKDGNKIVNFTKEVVQHIIARHVCRASSSPLVESGSSDLVAPIVFKECRFVFAPSPNLTCFTKHVVME
jgi:hypothetical protein